MNKKKILILLSIYLFGSMLIATTTISSICVDCECEIHIHVGHIDSDHKISDVQIYFSKKEIYKYQQQDLKKNIIIWKKYDPPFDDNKMVLSCEGKSKVKPKFKIEITGKKGKLIIKNKEFKIKCDWRR